MGYEYRPQAILYNLHRIHSVFPDKDIFITENGIATDDDEERIEFVTDVLNDIHDYVSKNGKVMGYLYWSCLLYTSPSPRDRQKSRMPSSA